MKHEDARAVAIAVLILVGIGYLVGLACGMAIG